MLSLDRIDAWRGWLISRCLPPAALISPLLSQGESGQVRWIALEVRGFRIAGAVANPKTLYVEQVRSSPARRGTAFSGSCATMTKTDIFITPLLSSLGNLIWAGRRDGSRLKGTVPTPLFPAQGCGKLARKKRLESFTEASSSYPSGFKLPECKIRPDGEGEKPFRHRPDRGFCRSSLM